MDLDELKKKLENSNEVVYPTGDYDKRERIAEPTDENIVLPIFSVNTPLPLALVKISAGVYLNFHNKLNLSLADCELIVSFILEYTNCDPI